MIKTREDLEYYMLCDKIALGKTKKKPGFIGDEMWKFQIIYRKTEYFYNNRSNLFNNIMFGIYYIYYRNLCKKLCSEIPLNVFREGLAIWHGQNIIINKNAKIGRNFSISNSCCVGHANNQFPIIGDNVEMTIGSKVIGGITVANNTTIGAGALIVKSITEENTTWGGYRLGVFPENRMSM